MTPTYRPDLQGLRAVAVALVVVYHVRPDWLPGGFVGVDVFFVLSGFFITSSLVAEATVDGRIHLRGFWARRIRRLMPAATAVLLAVLAATMLLAPLTVWTDALWQVVASATSWENWYLAAQSVDYLRADAPPSPLQHFWSLSVEEQFYLFWPFVLLAVSFLAEATRLRAWRVVVLVLIIGFFVVSIVETALSPSTAYFSTATRAWELLIGSAIAIWAGRRGLPREVATALVPVGIALIVASAALIDDTAPFPSATALLPTLGAAAIIVSGFGPRPVWLTLPLTWRPVRYLGDISYSLYLWHWPVIIFLGGVLGGGNLPTWAVAVAVGSSLVLAVLTYEFVERPFLGRTRFPRRPRVAHEPRAARSVFAAYRLGAALLAITLVATGLAVLNQQRAFAQLEADQDPRNFPGARVFDPAFDAADWNLRPVAPSPTAVGLEEIDRQFRAECLTELGNVDLTTCSWGDPDGDREVVVVGDSHVAQWLPALDAIATDRQWRIDFYGHQYCTLTSEDPPYWLDRPGFEFEACVEWNHAVLDRILGMHPDLVITGALAYGQPDWLGMTREEYGMRKATGYADSWTALLDAGIPVAAFDEIPQPNEVDLGDCVARPFTDPASCRTPQTPGDQWDDRIALAAGFEPRAIVIDVDDLVCPDGECDAAIGNVLVFRDDTHLTSRYAESLAWFVRVRLRETIPGMLAH